MSSFETITQRCARRGDHSPDEPPVRLLDVGATRQLGLGVLQAHGEGVADPLELGGREHPRPADRADSHSSPERGKAEAKSSPSRRSRSAI